MTRGGGKAAFSFEKNLFESREKVGGELLLVLQTRHDQDDREHKRGD